MTLSFQFDHLVHFVNDPKEALQLFREEGIHAVEGGVHTSFGTFNTLSYFDLSYIEFLGAFDQKLLNDSVNNKYDLMETIKGDGFVEGFSRIAIRTTQIDVLAAHFREQGLEVVGPVPLGRTRPDQSVLNWKLLFVGHPELGLPLPFIIQWEQGDDGRRTDLQETGALAPHRAGPLSLDFVAFAVKDLETTVDNWVKWLGLSKIGEPFVDASLQANCQLVQLTGTNLLFCSPIGDGVTADALAKRGERAFLAGIAGSALQEDKTILGGTYRFL